MTIKLKAGGAQAKAFLALHARPVKSEPIPIDSSLDKKPRRRKIKRKAKRTKRKRKAKRKRRK